MCTLHIVYLLDVLVVIVYMSYWNCWDFPWGECSEDWAGACRWGGGGEVEFLTEKKISAKKCSWGLNDAQKIKNRFFFFEGGGGRKISEFFFPTKIFFFQKCSWGIWNACKQKFIFRGGGGGFWGVWGAPRPHPGVARGRKTIHFFLWPWYVTG